MSTKQERPNIRIFPLEDSSEDVDLLRRALQSAELDCESIAMMDGAEALAFVRQQGESVGIPIPDLAILDLNVPKHGGLEVLEAMRMSRAFAGVPVAIPSASRSPREREEVEQFGGRFVTKSADLEQLWGIGSTLKSLLDESRAAVRRSSGA